MNKLRLHYLAKGWRFRRIFNMPVYQGRQPLASLVPDRMRKRLGILPLYRAVALRAAFSIAFSKSSEIENGLADIAVET